MRWLRSRRRLVLMRLLPVLAAVWFLMPLHSCPLATDLDNGECPSHDLAAGAPAPIAPCCDVGPAGIVPDLPLQSLHSDNASPSLLASDWTVRLVPQVAVWFAAHPAPSAPVGRPLHLTKRVLLI
jgi:hypothetical protein